MSRAAAPCDWVGIPSPLPSGNVGSKASLHVLTSPHHLTTITNIQLIHEFVSKNVSYILGIQSLQVQNKSTQFRPMTLCSFLRLSPVFLPYSLTFPPIPKARACGDLRVDPLSPAPAVNTSPLREQPCGR